MRWPLVVIGVTALGATAALYYTVNNLRINTYPGNVLSDELPWRKDLLAYEKAFPQSRDSIVIVVDAPTPDQARDAAAKLYRQLKEDTRHFEWVFFPPESEFFRQNGLLFEGLPDLESLSSRLAQVQPFLSEVSTDRSLRGLFSLLTRAMQEGKAEEIELGNVFRSIAGAIQGYLEGSKAHLSWIELMTGKKTAPQDRRMLIEVMPRIEFRSLAPGEASLDAIRDAAAALKLEQEGVRIRTTGEGALALDEVRSASIGAQVASVGSFLGVSLVMLIGLRSLWLVVCAQLALVLGLIFTAAFAAVAIGELNLISVAFSVMYIGIGADYAIYLCLRYRELARTSLSHRGALNRAVRHLAGSLEIGTLTTAIGFFCFVPTSYAGVAELGIISGVGMFISLIVTLAILPAMLSLRRPVRYRGPHLRHRPLPAFALAAMAFPARHAGWVLASAGVLAVMALFQLRSAQFDENPLNLQDPKAESVQALRELLRDSRHSAWSLAVLADNADQAARLERQLARLPLVDRVLTLEDFVPEDQGEKLALIDELVLTLGPNLGEASRRPEPTTEENEHALRSFLAALSAYLSAHPEASDAPAGAELQRELTRFIERIDGLPPEAKGEALLGATTVLLGSLNGQLSQLADALRAHQVGADDLPPDFRHRWVATNGQHRVEIRPKEDLNDPAAVSRFVEQVRTVAPHATGLPVVYLESGAAVVRAFLEAFAYAVTAITVVLFLMMHNKVDVLLVLLPLLLATVLTGAAITLLGIHFNFANIIALPLVFGMGVDNCIHMAHRFRTAPPRDRIVLHTSTAFAVVLSALTNVSGFGSLALSPHLGMASMGKVLTIGILTTLLCSLIVLPSLLSWVQRVNNRRNRHAPETG